MESKSAIVIFHKRNPDISIMFNFPSDRSPVTYEVWTYDNKSLVTEWGYGKDGIIPCELAEILCMSLADHGWTQTHPEPI